MTQKEIFEALEEKSDVVNIGIGKEELWRVIKESSYQEIKRKALVHYFVEDDFMFGEAKV